LFDRATGRGSAAGRDVEETREAKAAVEWAKAKAVWRRFGRVLGLLVLAIAFAFVYACGDLNGRIACLRPDQNSTL
jgi:hypothetical protein